MTRRRKMFQVGSEKKKKKKKKEKEKKKKALRDHSQQIVFSLINKRKK
jgi:hypothetical protein